ncbi:unnamed protein product [Symbiodinium microadriaticum]|nr:unnamed protein product [Symbiodinium microadriaticum]
MALSSVDHQMKAQKEVLVPILWAAWKDLVAERRRDETMDISRRAVEDDARKAQQEGSLGTRSAALCILDRSCTRFVCFALRQQSFERLIDIPSSSGRLDALACGLERMAPLALQKIAKGESTGLAKYVQWAAQSPEVEHVQTLKQRLHGTDFAAKIAAVASEQTPTGATAGPTRPGDVAVPVKPGLCGRQDPRTAAFLTT